MRCKKSIFRSLLTVAALSAVLPRCSDMGNLAGTVTQSGNGYVLGRVVLAGVPAAHAIVRLRPADYLADEPQADPPSNLTLSDTKTLADGSFVFDNVRPGDYRVEAIDTNVNRSVLFSFSIKKDTVRLFDTLRAVCAVTGTIDRMVAGSPAYAQIYGLERTAAIDSTGYFHFDNLPPGTYTIRIVTPAAQPVLIDGVIARPGETTRVPYAGWRYSKKLYLNTTSAGAGVATTVVNFPVLVRLTAANFNFSEAAPNGADLRFAKADSTTPLPFQVEQWDAAGSRAAIWVKVDTIYGNNATQSIMMYWGASPVSSLSSGAAVFDTAAGFKAVLHLDSSCTDATINRHDGRKYGTVTAQGIIGPAQRFDGTDSIIIAGLMDSLHTLTLSAWTNLDTCDLGAEVINIGNFALLRLDERNGTTDGVKAAYWYGSGHHVLTSGRYLQKTGWHYVSYTIDRTLHAQTISVDGVVISSGTFTDDISYTPDTVNYAGWHNHTTAIGRHATGWPYAFLFNGMIDEARVCSVARTPGWIKLCYMNQKPDDALIIF